MKKEDNSSSTLQLFFLYPTFAPAKELKDLNLIIDIGNTETKIASFNGEEIADMVAESNQSLGCLKAFCSKYPVEQGIAAAVIDLNEEVLADLTASPFPLLWFNHQIPFPAVNLYEIPETLGYDHMAVVVGANEQPPHRDILVIDAGTCITYGFTDSKGQYHGGNISPGIQMRFKALHQFTECLPLVDINGRKFPMGRDIKATIRAGVMRRMEHEASGYIESIKYEYLEFLVLLTGGDDLSFDSSVESIVFADRPLVLKKLSRTLNYNNNRI